MRNNRSVRTDLRTAGSGDENDAHAAVADNILVAPKVFPRALDVLDRLVDRGDPVGYAVVRMLASPPS